MERKLVFRGAGAGLIAGLLSFVFARVFAEPQIAKAIDYEGARDAAQNALDRAAGLAVPPETAEVYSRTVQADIGIALGMAVFAAAYGALLAVVFTLVQRGSGSHLRPRVLALLLAAAGFVGAYLVPFLKYPANPPAIGNEDTIGSRDSDFLLMVVLSLVALTLCVQLGRVLSRSRGTWQGSLLAGAVYIAAMTVVMLVLDPVHETPGPLKAPDGTIVLNGFDPDVLYRFRLYSVGAQVILWSALGLVFAPLAERVLGSTSKQQSPQRPAPVTA